MNDTDALNARIDALEMRLAYQDETIDDLNTTITAQWKQIDWLTRQLNQLLERVEEVEDSTGSAPADRPPPHY
jgi:SlyX protein